MGDYFKPWRRKIGVVTLVMACLFAAPWVRSQFVDDAVMISFGTRDLFLVSSSETLLLRYNWPFDGNQIERYKFDWKSHTKGSVYQSHTTPIGRFGAGGNFSRAPIWVPNHNVEQGGIGIWVQYWLFAVPLTLISLWLLLSNNDPLEWRKQNAKWFVVFASIAWVVLGVLSLLFAPFALFLVFVSPGAVINPHVWIFVLNIMIIPIVCLVTVVSSRQALRIGSFKKACWLATLPLINIAIALPLLG